MFYEYRRDPLPRLQFTGSLMRQQRPSAASQNSSQGRSIAIKYARSTGTPLLGFRRVHRRMVRKAIGSALPKARKKTERPRWKIAAAPNGRRFKQSAD